MHRPLASLDPLKGFSRNGHTFAISSHFEQYISNSRVRLLGGFCTQLCRALAVPEYGVTFIAHKEPSTFGQPHFALAKEGPAMALERAQADRAILTERIRGQALNYGKFANTLEVALA